MKRRQLSQIYVNTIKNKSKRLRLFQKKIKDHVATTDEKLGAHGTPIKSNITDNDSAKMKTSNGVIQGFVSVTAVDNKNR